MVSGDVDNIPVTVRRTDGQTVPLNMGAWFTQRVDVGQDPPVVIEKK
jgi:hypothetical protein